MKCLVLLIFSLIPLFCVHSEKVVLQLRWDNQFQFAGYYAALWEGYYEESGLDVEIRSAINGDDTILSAVEEVSSGRAHFGIGAADILIARDKGHDLVVTSVIFQESAAAFYTLEELEIRSPRDYSSVSVARRINDLIDIEFQAMLKAEGMDVDALDTRAHEPGLRHLLEGRAQSIPGYSISAPYEMLTEGIRYNEVKASDFGIDFYGDSIFTTSKLISEDPLLVENFTQASLKGWAYALENSAEIAYKISQLPRRAAITDFEGFNRFQIEGVKELTHYPVVSIGNINPARWEAMHRHLNNIGIVSNVLAIDDFIFDPDRQARQQIERRNEFFSLVTPILLAVVIASISTIIFMQYLLRRKTHSLEISESLFKDISENMPLFICRFDKNLKITYTNNSFLLIFNDSLDKLLGKSILDFMAIENRDEIEEKILALSLDNPVHVHINHKTDTNGNVTIQRWTTKILFNRKDNVYEYQSFGEDISEERKLQDQLLHKNKMDSVGQLSGGIAHDFNNMLAGIMNSVQLLKRTVKDPEKVKKSEQYVDLIMNASHRASELIHKLMAFSRKETIHTELINLHTIIDETVSILDKTINKNIKMNIQKTSADCFINGESPSLQSVIMNLCINASHAMPDGGVLEIITKEIELSHSYCELSPFDLVPGDYCDLEILDTGSGISEENLQRIFEPFFTTKEQGKGTGLGLSVVYGVVNSHKGEIKVYSEVGTGTAFHILLPLVHESELAVTGETVALKGSGTILLTDDEEILRTVGKEMLQDLGYTVLVAENGLEAVNLFEKEHNEIDLVIIDMIMPEMDGKEAFYKMKEIDPNCKVILASGYTRAENVKEMKDRGLSGFIKKPFTVEDFSQVVSEILNEPAS